MYREEGVDQLNMPILMGDTCSIHNNKSVASSRLQNQKRTILFDRFSISKKFEVFFKTFLSAPFCQALFCMRDGKLFCDKGNPSGGGDNVKLKSKI